MTALGCEGGEDGEEAEFQGTMDYWEQYDPETVQVEGKAVIVTGDCLPIDSICFLCGSAGREELVYCRVCCESYHPFCLNTEDLVCDLQ